MWYDIYTADDDRLYEVGCDIQRHPFNATDGLWVLNGCYWLRPLSPPVRNKAEIVANGRVLRRVGRVLDLPMKSDAYFRQDYERVIDAFVKHLAKNGSGTYDRFVHAFVKEGTLHDHVLVQNAKSCPLCGDSIRAMLQERER